MGSFSIYQCVNCGSAGTVLRQEFGTPDYVCDNQGACVRKVAAQAKEAGEDGA